MKSAILVAVLGMAAASIAQAGEFDVKFCAEGHWARLTLTGRQVVLTEAAGGEVYSSTGEVIQGGRLNDKLRQEFAAAVSEDLVELNELDIALQGADEPLQLFIARTGAGEAFLYRGGSAYGPVPMGTDRGCR